MFHSLIQKTPFVCVCVCVCGGGGSTLKNECLDDRMDERETEKEFKVSILIEREKERPTEWANEQ